MLRFTPAKATKKSPFEAAFGFRPHVPTLLQAGQLEGKEIDYAALEAEAARYDMAETLLRQH